MPRTHLDPLKPTLMKGLALCISCPGDSAIQWTSLSVTICHKDENSECQSGAWESVLMVISHPPPPLAKADVPR